MRVSVSARVYAVFGFLIVQTFAISTYLYFNERQFDTQIEMLSEQRLSTGIRVAKITEQTAQISKIVESLVSDANAYRQSGLFVHLRSTLSENVDAISQLASDAALEIPAEISKNQQSFLKAFDQGQSISELHSLAVEYATVVQQFAESIVHQLDGKHEILIQTENKAREMAMFMVIAGLILAGFAMLYLYRSVIYRLLKLQSSMSAFIEGRDAEIPTAGNDEIASMGRALDYLVTTLKRREARLEEQLLFQRTLLDTIPNPIFYKDDSGHFTGANAAFEMVVGLTPDEIIGKTPFDIDRPDLAERYDPQDRGTGPSRRRYSYEAQKAFADGKKHHVMIEKAHFINDDGKSSGVAGVMVDITRLKEAERELHDAKELAETANQAKSNFLAAMSHEIRTPMNGVTGMVELLEQTRLEREQRQMLRTVRESAESLLHIIDDILDFSKIEAGRMDLESVPVSISSLISGVAETLAPNIRKQDRDVSLIAFTDPDVPAYVKSDPVRLRQILVNLAGNAAKFTEAGKVVIAAEKGDMRGGVATIRFRVSDTGIGISKANQIKLFEAFTQAEGSITRRFGGTGLGLSISRRLVDLMGGKIGVESELGQGATFWFELPLDVCDPPADLSNADPLPKFNNLNVMICLEDSEERKFIERYCQHNNIRCTTVDAVGQMLERCTLHDAVIVDDWSGSGGSSDELASAIADETVAQQTPGIIKLKNQPSVIDKKSKPAPGVSLQRPYNEHALMEAIGVACGLLDPGRMNVTAEDDNQVAYNAPPSIAHARAAGRLILAVEDHPVNRQVLMRQLHTLGYAVVLAENGVEALEKWQEGGFALVLTDCHMPEMDGFELTAAIRAAEETTGKHIPIIAATANALQGEAENCLQAGMDGYLAKPVKLDALANEIARWLPGGAMPLPSNDPTEVTTKDDVIDFSVLKAICHGDETMLLELLGDFIDINQSVIEDLMGAVERRQNKDIHSHAHKLKGSAGTAGAKRLAEAAKVLEKSNAEDEDGTLDEMAKTLLTEFESVRAKIISIKG